MAMQKVSAERTAPVARGPLVLATVVLLATFLGCRCREDDWARAYPNETEHTAYVVSRVAAAKELPVEQRARSIWELWIDVRHTKGWTDTHAYADTVFAEFLACGAAGMQVILDEIQAARDPSASEAADAAVLFGPEIIQPLLDKLSSKDPRIRFFAISAVDYCIILDLDAETRDRIQQAVAPLANDESLSVRIMAQMLLEDLARMSH